MSDDPASRGAFQWECNTRQIRLLQIKWEAMGDMANAERYLASLTIQKLMDEVEALKCTIRANDREIFDLIQQRRELISNAHKLRSELDEARLHACTLR